MPLTVQDPQAVPIDTIAELRALLAATHRPLTIDELTHVASRLRLDPQDWRQHLAFSEEHFCFQTIYESPHFEINVIGWRTGQFSSAHDHRGTACCVLVLAGVLTNIDYRLNGPYSLQETGRFHLQPGELLPRTDLDIHRCGNEQADGSDLVTLHLYSPPLRPLTEREHSP